MQLLSVAPFGAQAFFALLLAVSLRHIDINGRLPLNGRWLR